MLLEAYYELHKAQLISVLAKYSQDYETSADAVQESFLKALKNRDALSCLQEKSLWSWLYTTAQNVLIDEKRKARRQEYFADNDEADIPDDCSDPTDSLLARELLYKLPPNLMHVVSLRYFGGLNASEIGVLKGIPALL